MSKQTCQPLEFKNCILQSQKLYFTNKSFILKNKHGLLRGSMPLTVPTYRIFFLQWINGWICMISSRLLCSMNQWTSPNCRCELHVGYFTGHNGHFAIEFFLFFENHILLRKIVLSYLLLKIVQNMTKSSILTLKTSPLLLTEKSMLPSTWNSLSALSLLPSQAGMVSIRLWDRLRIWTWSKVSRPSIRAMQLQLRSSSLRRVRWARRSIFWIWLKDRFRTWSRFSPSRFSMYWTNK